MALDLKDDHSREDVVCEINMTPLIDIMMVLLIIFMMTSSITLESGLDIDLPKTTSQTNPKEGTAVLISLDRSGAISVQGKKIEFAQLAQAIKEALTESKSEVVVFEGDQESNLGMAIKIMDIAKGAGAAKFAIATEQVPGGQSP
ncbi:MAG: biopolymer transporter ExbD [Pseudomonadota bacterium]